MNIEINIPANSGVIKYLLREKAKAKKSPPIALPDSVKNPYSGAGSHPDIVQQVWDVLGAGLPLNCRFMVYGTPALVQPESGIILAVAIGTQYALRVPIKKVQEALKAGARLEIEWSFGGVFNVQNEFGADWVLGGYSQTQVKWCREVYNSTSL